MTILLQGSTVAQALKAGLEHHQAGRLLEAECIYRTVLGLEPDNADALGLLGHIARQFGHHGLAADLLTRAAQKQPSNPYAANYLGEVYLELLQPVEAAAWFRKAIALKIDHAEAHFNLGLSLTRLGQWDEAEQSYRRALALDPANADAMNNLANALLELGRIDEAEHCYREATAANPKFAAALVNLGNLLQELGKFEESEQAYARVLAQDPASPKAQFGVAMLKLRHGDYASGFAMYESRFAAKPRGSDPEIRTLESLRGVPRWDGTPLEGKALLVWAEQGLGDGLMMMRYLPLLKAERHARRLIVACPTGLTRIIQALPGVDRVVSTGDALPVEEADCHCPMMSLPFAFGTVLETVPGTVPYIVVPDELERKWAGKIPGSTKLKVALAWSGGNAFKHDRQRSMDLRALEPVLAIEGAEFFSLQKGPAAQELASFDGKIVDWMPHTTDFLEDAALVKQMDLVISVDTSVAHLAGALGKPLWLMSKQPGHWTWMHARTDSPWYPTMRIFRQLERGDWSKVIADVAKELRKMV